MSWRVADLFVCSRSCSAQPRPFAPPPRPSPHRHPYRRAAVTRLSANSGHLPGPASPVAARQPHVRVVALAHRAPTTVPGDLSCCARALGSQQFPSEGLGSRRCGTGGPSARAPREQHSALSQAEASASFAWVAAAPENPRPDLRSGQPVRLLPVPPPAPPSSAQSGLHPLSRTPLLRPAHVPLRAVFSSAESWARVAARAAGGLPRPRPAGGWRADQLQPRHPRHLPALSPSLSTGQALTFPFARLSLSPDPSVARPVFVLGVLGRPHPSFREVVPAHLPKFPCCRPGAPSELAVLSSRPKFYVLSSRRTIPSLHAVVTAQRVAARARGGPPRPRLAGAWRADQLQPRHPRHMPPLSFHIAGTHLSLYFLSLLPHPSVSCPVLVRRSRASSLQFT